MALTVMAGVLVFVSLAAVVVLVTKGLHSLWLVYRVTHPVQTVRRAAGIGSAETAQN